MATTNPLALPLKIGSSVDALPYVPKIWTGGNNLSLGPVAQLGFAAAASLFGKRRTPNSLDNSAAVKFQALVTGPVAGAAGKKVRLEVGYKIINSGDTMDFSSWTEPLAQSLDVASLVAKQTLLVEWTMTSSNFVAARHLEYYLKRDGVHADDNYDNPVFVHDFWMLCSY